MLRFDNVVLNEYYYYKKFPSQMIDMWQCYAQITWQNLGGEGGWPQRRTTTAYAGRRNFEDTATLFSRLSSWKIGYVKGGYLGQTKDSYQRLIRHNVISSNKLYQRKRVFLHNISVCCHAPFVH